MTRRGFLAAAAAVLAAPVSLLTGRLAGMAGPFARPLITPEMLEMQRRKNELENIMLARAAFPVYFLGPEGVYRAEYPAGSFLLTSESVR